MKRSIPRSLVRPSKTVPKTGDEPSEDQEKAGAETPAAFKRATSGAGSAWKSGAVAQAQGDLDDARAKLAADILSGSHIIEIDPNDLTDPIGTDRRDDWMGQDTFLEFLESIKEHGQDMPVLVWPKDPNWRPDDIHPENLERVQFLLLAGRRRREAAKKLGRPVRAVIASQEGRDGAEATFQMLVMRFRENDEREDLSAFERLLSIGQMYEELSKATNSKVIAKDFADRIGVHESIVSRARAVFKAKTEILNAFKNVYDMSFRELQSALATLAVEKKQAPKKSAKPERISVIHKVGSRNLSLTTQAGKLSINTSGLTLNKSDLDALGSVIADHLNKLRSK